MTETMKAPKMSKAELSALVAEAFAAGDKAGNEVVPEPMYVGPNSMFLNGKPILDKVYKVDEGVCGFAWVTVHPGNSSLANLLKKEHGARKGHYGGMELWVSKFNQSMTRKEAFARAFAKVLTDAGFRAYAGSRMD